VALGAFLVGSREKLLNWFIGSIGDEGDGVREERGIAWNGEDELKIERSSNKSRKHDKSHSR